MRKIPTALVRDPDDRAHVLNEITPGCEWVFAGEGVATRKYDGTCVLLETDGTWWARREVKPGKEAPPNYISIGTDEVTGKTTGWEPIEQSSFVKAFNNALKPTESGTYELCGPKVNGNPENFISHVLVSHAAAAERVDAPRDIPSLAAWLQDTEFEGIVWHHPDGRMAKLKKRDIVS